MQISEHFSSEESMVSETAERFGINNMPPDWAKENIYKTATKMEKVREILKNPIHINSWYRCPELNNRIGSGISSDHLLGMAVDFICPAFGSPLLICQTLISEQILLRYKQLILEHTWVHISWESSPNVQPRLEVLSLLASGGYAQGLTDRLGNPL